MRDLRVAEIGAGPAGIYAADILTTNYDRASVDRILEKPRIRFIGNVDYGTDLTLDELRMFYDAVIFATGAMDDRRLDIPGVDLPGSHEAADSPLSDVPFDHVKGVIPNVAGQVLDAQGAPLPATYVTGWIKRGPVGLIGHTKSDASETINRLLTGLDALPTAASHDPDSVLAYLTGKGIEHTNIRGWERLDAHETSLGERAGRPRIKIVEREEMVEFSRDTFYARENSPAQVGQKAHALLDNSRRVLTGGWCAGSGRKGPGDPWVSGTSLSG